MLFFFYLITACLAVPKDLVPQAKPKAEDLLAKIKTSNNTHIAKVLISSLTNADPAAVSHVKSLVEALIAAGEAERNAATTARDDAQTAFDTASSNLDTATEEHTTVAGQLSNAQDEVTRLTDLKAVHLTDQENAQDAFDAASTALDTAETWLSDETVRIDGEKATLEEIRSLLTGLLGTAGGATIDGGLSLDNWELVGGATIDGGVMKCDAGVTNFHECYIISKSTYARPISVSWTSRLLRDNERCIVTDVFPQNDDRHSGYSMGYGWWSYYLGYGLNGVQNSQVEDGDTRINHVYKMVLTDTRVEFYQDDDMYHSMDSTTYMSGKIRIGKSDINFEVSDVTVTNL
jgi:hypothetical protein